MTKYRPSKQNRVYPIRQEFNWLAILSPAFQKIARMALSCFEISLLFAASETTIRLLHYNLLFYLVVNQDDSYWIVPTTQQHKAIDTSLATLPDTAFVALAVWLWHYHPTFGDRTAANVGCGWLGHQSNWLQSLVGPICFSRHNLFTARSWYRFRKLGLHH